MEFIDCITHPKTFFGFTDLKTGTLVISIIEIVLLAISLFSLIGFIFILYTVPALVLSILGIIGVNKERRSYVYAFEILKLVELILCVVGTLFSFAVIPVSIVLLVLFILLDVYFYTVVRAYRKTMPVAKEVPAPNNKTNATASDRANAPEVVVANTSSDNRSATFISQKSLPTPGNETVPQFQYANPVPIPSAYVASGNIPPAGYAVADASGIISPNSFVVANTSGNIPPAATAPTDAKA